MPICVIQRIEALTVRDGQDIDDGDEPFFVDRFSIDNDLSVALHEGGIIGVAQDNNEQEFYDDDEDRKTDEEPANPPGTTLEPAAAHGEITGSNPPEHPVELPGVAPLENPVELLAVAPPENEV